MFHAILSTFQILTIIFFFALEVYQTAHIFSLSLSLLVLHPAVDDAKCDTMLPSTLVLCPLPFGNQVNFFETCNAI